MDSSERLKNLDNSKLIDVVRNYKRYGYDDVVRNAAITLLNERGYTIEELSLLGYLENQDYDEAVKQYNAFCRNSKIAILFLLLSGGLLSVIYIIMIYMAYRSQNRFYLALNRKNDNPFIYDIFGVMFYFHVRDKMKEELKGIR